MNANSEQDWSAETVGEAINIIQEDSISILGSKVSQTYILLADEQTYRLVWSLAPLDVKVMEGGRENFLVYKDFTRVDCLEDVISAVLALWAAFYFGTEDQVAS